MGAKLAKNAENLYMHVRFILVLCLIFVSQSVKASHCQKMDEIQWILGNWKMNKKNQTIVENWQQISPSTFEGYGKVINKSTASETFESLRIVEMQQQLFYLAKVKENLLPVPFKAVKCEDGLMVFENNDHDFPNTLTYRLIEDKLHVDVRDKQQQGFSLIFTQF